MAVVLSMTEAHHHGGFDAINDSGAPYHSGHDVINDRGSPSWWLLTAMVAVSFIDSGAPYHFGRDGINSRACASTRARGWQSWWGSLTRTGGDGRWVWMSSRSLRWWLTWMAIAGHRGEAGERGGPFGDRRGRCWTMATAGHCGEAARGVCAGWPSMGALIPGGARAWLQHAGLGFPIALQPSTETQEHVLKWEGQMQEEHFKTNGGCQLDGGEYDVNVMVVNMDGSCWRPAGFKETVKEKTAHAFRSRNRMGKHYKEQVGIVADGRFNSLLCICKAGLASVRFCMLDRQRAKARRNTAFLHAHHSSAMLVLDRQHADT
eukprot:scaffold69093_cov21-Tisochrysis_lutea.AAC.1